MWWSSYPDQEDEECLDTPASICSPDVNTLAVNDRLAQERGLDDQSRREGILGSCSTERDDFDARITGDNVPKPLCSVNCRAGVVELETL